MNNIFKFATGELSQDAFICWFFNWFNEGDNQKLRQLVIEFCKEKLGISTLSSVDIHRQFSKKVEKDGNTFSVKIDVLVILNKETAVIIEDKTFTSEHNNQIMRYEEGLDTLKKQDKEGKLRIDDRAYNISKILTIYWKTGFFYDCDKCVKANAIVDSEYLISFLGNFRSEDEIIDMYVQKLIDDKHWYEEHAKYWDRANDKGTDDFWDTNLSNNQIAQYTMMREFFPGEMWTGGDLYYVYHGSSFGRPWTEMTVYCNRKIGDPDEDKRFEIFWRIDTDKNGSYISLRLYKKQKGKWDSKYKDIQNCVEEYINAEGSYSWAKVYPGKKDSYKEADIVHFSINKDDWEMEREHLKKVIRNLTSNVLSFAQKKYGLNVCE